MSKIKYLIFIITLLFINNIYSQKLDTVFNGYLSPVVQTGGVAPNFNFTGAFHNDLGTFDGTEVTTDAVLIMESDGNCYELPIVSLSATGTIVSGVVNDPSAELAAIPSGTAAVVRRTDNKSLYPIPAGLPQSTEGCIHTINMLIIDTLFNATTDTSGYNRSFYIAGDSLYIVDDNDTLFVDITDLSGTFQVLDTTVTAVSYTVDLSTAQEARVVADVRGGVKNITVTLPEPIEGLLGKKVTVLQTKDPLYSVQIGQSGGGNKFMVKDSSGLAAIVTSPVDQKINYNLAVAYDANSTEYVWVVDSDKDQVIDPTTSSNSSIQTSLNNIYSQIGTLAPDQTITVYQAAHGFALPSYGFIPVYQDTSGLIIEASATNSETTHAYYIVGIPHVDSIKIQSSGKLVVSGGHGLSIGKTYYLNYWDGVSTTPDDYIIDALGQPLNDTTMSLGIGLTIIKGSSGRLPLDPYYNALLDYWTSQGYTLPPVNVRDEQNNLFSTLTTNNIWATAIAIYMPANYLGVDSSSLINVKSPSDTTFALTIGAGAWYPAGDFHYDPVYGISIGGTVPTVPRFTLSTPVGVGVINANINWSIYSSTRNVNNLATVTSLPGYIPNSIIGLSTDATDFSNAPSFFVGKEGGYWDRIQLNAPGFTSVDLSTWAPVATAGYIRNTPNMALFLNGSKLGDYACTSRSDNIRYYHIYRRNLFIGFSAFGTGVLTDTQMQNMQIAVDNYLTFLRTL